MGGSSDKETISDIRDFSAGLITAVPTNMVPLGGASDLQNADIFSLPGALKKRLGTSVWSAEKAGLAFPYISGMTQFITSGGTTYILAVSTDDIYATTAGIWTSIYTNAALNGADVNFVTFKDLLIAVSSVITTQKWTGVGGTSDLLGTPPANAKYVCVHKGRVWIANHAAGKSRLNYSKLDDCEDWTATGDTGAGYYDINPNDGDEITGICSVGGVLLIFKRHSVYVMRGHKPSNFTWSPISTQVGCVCGRTIVVFEGFAVFLSDYGVYSGSSESVGLLSRNIQPTIDAISTTVKQNAVGGRLRDQYWLAYDGNADAKNDTAYVLDLKMGAWSKYTNIKARCFLTDSANILYSGGSDKTIVRQHNTGTDDDDATTTMYWTSGDIDWGSFAHDKQGMGVWLDVATIAAKTLKLDHYIMGIDQSDTLTFSIAPTTTETRIVKSDNFKQASQGRYFKFKLTQDQAAATVAVYGLEFFVMMRQYRD